MDIVHEPANGPQVLIKAFREEDPDGTRLARVFRESFDQINDGQNTGRYSISQLSKTESAHLGSIVEINIRREFDGFINDGKWMDYEIAGYEVDCKYSKMPFGWMIPMEPLATTGCSAMPTMSQRHFVLGSLA
nr:NaeI family type II restriction endonuclease [Corynebacterium camporealensis]